MKWLWPTERPHSRAPATSWSRTPSPTGLQGPDSWARHPSRSELCAQPAVWLKGLWGLCPSLHRAERAAHSRKQTAALAWVSQSSPAFRRHLSSFTIFSHRSGREFFLSDPFSWNLRRGHTGPLHTLLCSQSLWRFVFGVCFQCCASLHFPQVIH